MVSQASVQLCHDCYIVNTMSYRACSMEARKYLLHKGNGVRHTTALPQCTAEKDGRMSAPAWQAVLICDCDYSIRVVLGRSHTTKELGELRPCIKAHVVRCVY